MTVLLASLAMTATALSEKKPAAPPRTPWSFLPLKQASLPTVKDTAWPKTRIDWFILAKMEAAGLHPASRADARTLARRLAFDLTGLPPDSPAASIAVRSEIERLLASPHYGERWARHWLDLARYTDITPDWLDSTKYAWRYRDWVVQAFNEDLPYNRFIVRQLATDYLPECGPQDLVALGFLGLSPTYFKELQLPPEIIKTTVADEWEEHVDAIGRTFLGLTIACARCHDHKSDPITTRDYYALAGVFASVKLSERPTMGDEFWLPVKKAREQVAALEKQLADLKKKKPAPADLKQQTGAIEQRIAAIKSGTPHYDMLMANAVEEAALFVTDADTKKGTKLDFKPGMARDLELQKRGNPNDLGDIVPRQFLSAFPVNGRPRPFTTGSGRLDLAKALTEEAAPLTARVIVNRVWKHHFGRGLVDTPSEFGNLGEAPTHPELLDDLTARFIAANWSIKWLHREILNSATWQQASFDHAASGNAMQSSISIDPDNKLYARMTRRRLDWETWRDCLLTATGMIDLTPGGPALKAIDPANKRRSLYSASDRQDMEQMLRVHDVPDPGAHSPWRTETITPLQGLFALNSPFMQQQADAFGSWMQTHGIDAAFTRLFAREPTSTERQAVTQFISGREKDAAAWSQCAQALLAGNELLFVD